MTRFEKIVAFSTRKYSENIRTIDQDRDWSNYTTISQAFEFSRRHKLIKYLIESRKLDAVSRKKKPRTG